jgi:hypothetical protein
MKAIYKQLLDKSIAAALAAIEIYNKPDFRYREESFVILIINAWELLLKAKILKDTKNRMSSLYIHFGKNNRKIKRSRTGNPLTIELFGAMQKLSLDAVVVENLASLVEIRDTAVHFYNDDGVRYVVYTLGVAALRNYQHFVKDWFKRSLTAYHFYILPIGFSHSFRTFRPLDLESTPTVVAKLFRAVAEAQARTKTDSPFFFACEIATELKSAKKFAEPADITVKIDASAQQAAVVITQTKRKLDQYPFSFRELVERVKKSLPAVRVSLIPEMIKKHKLKDNEAYSAYSFRTKAQEDAFLKTKNLPKGITSIYNEDAVRFVIEKLEELPSKPAPTTRNQGDLT